MQSHMRLPQQVHMQMPVQELNQHNILAQKMQFMMQPILETLSFPQPTMMCIVQPLPIMNFQSQAHSQLQHYANSTTSPQTNPAKNTQSGTIASMVQKKSTQAPNSHVKAFNLLSQQTANIPQSQYALQMSISPIQQPMWQTLPCTGMQQQEPKGYSNSNQSLQIVTQVTSLPSSPVTVTSFTFTGNLQVHQAPSVTQVNIIQEVAALSDDTPTNNNLKKTPDEIAAVIDNKIEQFMNIIKQHLILIVSEEVNALNETIAKLTQRISQLESENNILRAAARP